MTTMSERDVVFTPFMRRVRALLDGDEAAPAQLPTRSSELRQRAAAVDTWFSLRTRSEQLVAEANAMMDGRCPLIDLVDESGTGELAFTLRHGRRWARLRVHDSGPAAFVELEPWTGRSAAPTEPVDGAALEDLLAQLIDPTAGKGNT
jgi:hypothetical protein